MGFRLVVLDDLSAGVLQRARRLDGRLRERPLRPINGGVVAPGAHRRPAALRRGTSVELGRGIWGDWGSPGVTRVDSENDETPCAARGFGGAGDENRTRTVSLGRDEIHSRNISSCNMFRLSHTLVVELAWNIGRRGTAPPGHVRSRGGTWQAGGRSVRSRSFRLVGTARGTRSTAGG